MRENMHKEIIGQTQFNFSKANTSEHLDEIFRLRYKVYCHECKFLDPQKYPQEKEEDKYDPNSVHFFASDDIGIIGTARIILNSKEGFPLESHCKNKLAIKKELLPDPKSTAEISRLVISKEYRRRQEDGSYYSPDYNDVAQTNNEQEQLKRLKPMAFGLYRELYQECKRRNISHLYALMEKSLFFLLYLHGFAFKPIGEEIDVYGPVKPYLGSVEEIEKNIHHKYPNLFNYLIDGLEPEFRPKNV
jgi:N-acyl amino acid synthase of PEP-CTERM/exosortase system